VGKIGSESSALILFVLQVLVADAPQLEHGLPENFCTVIEEAQNAG